MITKYVQLSTTNIFTLDLLRKQTCSMFCRLHKNNFILDNWLFAIHKRAVDN